MAKIGTDFNPFGTIAGGGVPTFDSAKQTVAVGTANFVLQNTNISKANTTTLSKGVDITLDKF
jgi:hypothetical protein